VFVSTINRNLKSFLLAIVAAEYLLKLIPRGTHEYERLIRPGRACALGTRGRFAHVSEIAGLDFSPLTQAVRLTRDPAVNYIAHLES
jgi:2-polyprenyl-6-hydroxyphenyl methylase/3-demethylubiquinone-9 3-methyltransferase